LKVVLSRYLVGLANEIMDGSMQRLANNINASLIKVSADLDRLTAATPTDRYVDNELVSPPGECVYDYEVTAETVFNKLEVLISAKHLDQTTCRIGFCATLFCVV